MDWDYEILLTCDNKITFNDGGKSSRPFKNWFLWVWYKLGHAHLKFFFAWKIRKIVRSRGSSSRCLLYINCLPLLYMYFLILFICRGSCKLFRQHLDIPEKKTHCILHWAVRIQSPLKVSLARSPQILSCPKMGWLMWMAH